MTRVLSRCAELVRLGGKALLPDARPTFDVWSLGVVLYLLCTGQWLLTHRPASPVDLKQSRDPHAVDEAAALQAVPRTALNPDNRCFLLNEAAIRTR